MRAEISRHKLIDDDLMRLSNITATALYKAQVNKLVFDVTVPFPDPCNEDDIPIPDRPWFLRVYSDNEDGWVWVDQWIEEVDGSKTYLIRHNSLGYTVPRRCRIAGCDYLESERYKDLDPFLCEQHALSLVKIQNADGNVGELFTCDMPYRLVDSDGRVYVLDRDDNGRLFLYDSKLHNTGKPRRSSASLTPNIDAIDVKFANEVAEAAEETCPDCGQCPCKYTT